MVKKLQSILQLQSIVIGFLLFSLCPTIALAQTSKELKLKKLRGDKEVVFKNNTPIRVVTTSGDVIRGRISEVNGQNLLLADDTSKVDLNSIVHLRRTTVLRPLATVVATAGTVFVVFGTVGWASSVGSEDVWASLGAVVGALIAVSGGILDAASLPVLFKTRKFRVSGNKAKWTIIQ